MNKFSKNMIDPFDADNGSLAAIAEAQAPSTEQGASILQPISDLPLYGGNGSNGYVDIDAQAAQKKEAEAAAEAPTTEKVVTDPATEVATETTGDEAVTEDESPLDENGFLKDWDTDDAPATDVETGADEGEADAAWLNELSAITGKPIAKKNEVVAAFKELKAQQAEAAKPQALPEDFMGGKAADTYKDLQKKIEGVTDFSDEKVMQEYFKNLKSFQNEDGTPNADLIKDRISAMEVSGDLAWMAEEKRGFLSGAYEQQKSMLEYEAQAKLNNYHHQADMAVEKLTNWNGLAISDKQRAEVKAVMKDGKMVNLMMPKGVVDLLYAIGADGKPNYQALAANIAALQKGPQMVAKLKKMAGLDKWRKDNKVRTNGDPKSKVPTGRKSVPKSTKQPKGKPTVSDQELAAFYRNVAQN